METTIYRYEKPDIEMSFTKRLNRKFVEELADDLAMVTAIIFMVECDLKNMPPHSIAAMRDMFAGMLAKSMDLTFHLKGRGSFRKLPLDALHIERAFIDVFDVNGFQGDISFSEWFNKDAVRISKLTSYGMHWQYLANYQKLQLDRLHIVANDDNEYLDVLCQLIVMPLKQFRVRLVDGNKVLAEWEKTSIYQRDGDKYVHELLVRIWTIDEAELLASFLYVHKPNDFIDIDINMKVERVMFVDVYDELRKPLEPFNRYRVQDYKKQRNGRTDAVNVIEVIDRKFFGRLVSDFVTLPSGERFTSIELEFDDLVELEPADVDWVVDWLADCRKVERLEIIDHDMDLLSKTVELVLFDKVSEEGEFFLEFFKTKDLLNFSTGKLWPFQRKHSNNEIKNHLIRIAGKYPDAFDKLIEVKSTIVGSYWVRFLFDWPACERLRFYMKTKNTYSGIKAKAENVRWKEDRCNDTEQLDSFTCAKFRRNNNKRISFGHRSAVRLTAT